MVRSLPPDGEPTLSAAATGGTGPTSDTGWGCMLRCGQMIFAQALLCRHLGRGESRWGRVGGGLGQMEMRGWASSATCWLSVTYKRGSKEC